MVPCQIFHALFKYYLLIAKSAQFCAVLVSVLVLFLLELWVVDWGYRESDVPGWFNSALRLLCLLNLLGLSSFSQPVSLLLESPSLKDLWCCLIVRPCGQHLPRSTWTGAGTSGSRPLWCIGGLDLFISSVELCTLLLLRNKDTYLA